LGGEVDFLHLNVKNDVVLQFLNVGQLDPITRCPTINICRTTYQAQIRKISRGQSV
jgi:hypothetical protein